VIPAPGYGGPRGAAPRSDTLPQRQEVKYGNERRFRACAGGSPGQHRHICAFFNSIDDEHRVLRSFIKEGFDRGDKAFHIVDPELQGEHLKRLAEAGIDVEQAMGTGQLELQRWQDASGAAAGYPLTRLVTHMEWAGGTKNGFSCSTSPNLRSRMSLNHDSWGRRWKGF